MMRRESPSTVASSRALKSTWPIVERVSGRIAPALTWKRSGVRPGIALSTSTRVSLRVLRMMVSWVASLSSLISLSTLPPGKIASWTQPPSSARRTVGA